MERSFINLSSNNKAKRSWRNGSDESSNNSTLNWHLKRTVSINKSIKDNNCWLITFKSQSLLCNPNYHMEWPHSNRWAKGHCKIYWAWKDTKRSSDKLAVILKMSQVIAKKAFIAKQTKLSRSLSINLSRISKSSNHFKICHKKKGSSFMRRV